MKYVVEIDGYTAEVKLDTKHTFKPDYVQDVVRFYAALAAQHLSVAPELQDELTRRVIEFSRDIAKEVENGKLGMAAVVNSCAGARQSDN